jgi:hypothetical protein
MPRGLPYQVPLSPREAEYWWAPASPIRLGQPFLGMRAFFQTARLVLAFNWRVARESWLASWRWAWHQGLPASAVIFVLAAIAGGVGEKGEHVLHAIVTGLAAFGAFMIALFVGHCLVAPLRLIEEERRRLREGAGPGQGSAQFGQVNIIVTDTEHVGQVIQQLGENTIARPESND